MHDNMMHADSVDYTWLEGNGPQPEPTAYAYTIRGETITAEPCAPCHHIYDVATFPERLDADIAALREELATLRAMVTGLEDALAEVGVRIQ